jgi:phosphoribosylamine--glycine ligase
MKILIIGNGGREHAFAWKCSQSKKVTQIYVAPGNGGTAKEEKVKNININAEDIDSLLNFAKEEKNRADYSRTRSSFSFGDCG